MDTGATLLRSKKFPYALFFGHLSIEKLLKALVVKHSGYHAPFSHSLGMLAARTGIEFPEDVNGSVGGVHGVLHGSALS